MYRWSERTSTAFKVLCGALFRAESGHLWHLAIVLPSPHLIFLWSNFELESQQGCPGPPHHPPTFLQQLRNNHVQLSLNPLIRSPTTCGNRTCTFDPTRQLGHVTERRQGRCQGQKARREGWRRREARRSPSGSCKDNRQRVVKGDWLTDWPISDPRRLLPGPFRALHP